MAADELDFDVVGDSRPAVLWQMAGRCVGIARLLLDAVELGYTAEVLHVARALHEADRLADILGNPDESPLLSKWLVDEGDEWSDRRKCARPRHDPRNGSLL